ncbi:hypothetical protein BGX28_003315 [Mortierella sp. GBA30]|nr:hypothetical protein BGX28_003315 [Mortierella sp. GBA30]
MNPILNVPLQEETDITAKDQTDSKDTMPISESIHLPINNSPETESGPAQQPQESTPLPSSPRRRISNTYYARLSAPPGTDEARKQHVVVRQALLSLPGLVAIRHEFGADEDDVLNVISFKLDGNSHGLEAVAALPSVIGIYPVRTRTRPKALPLGSLAITRPSLDSAHILTGIKMAQEKLGLTGKGIKVGIIDTGVDYKHPALGGCFGPGCKVAFGHDFVGDDYDNAVPEKDVPKPDGDPMDCAGHGTHVAGIVAARNQGPKALGPQAFVGVAPDATLGAYRVFGCDGEVGDDVLLAAMKAAYRDGMDIVNLSLGGSSSWPEEPFATACSAYIQKGLHIATANGNDGEEGLFEDGAPATAAGAIAVGSVDNTEFLGPAAELTWQIMEPHGQGNVSGEYVGQIGMAMGADSSDVPLVSFRSDITYVIHVPGNPVDSQGCTSYKDAEFEGIQPVSRSKIIVLLRRGGCTFSDKAKNVVHAKLGGMLVYDSVPEQKPLGMSIIGCNISAAGLSFEDATLILNAAKAKHDVSTSPFNGGVKLTARFSSTDQVLKLPSGGKISDFSSWGPDARLRYKPDIVTPGGMIYSTFPLSKGGFATLQGTSMSSPYMAGIQALFLQKYGKTEPAKLLNVLQSTAVPTILPGSTTSLTSVFQQGGGLASMARLFADDPPAMVTPTALFLNDTQFQKLDHVVSIMNPSTSKTTRKWMASHRPAVSINGFEGNNHYAPVNQSLLRSSELGAKDVTVEPSELVLGPGATGMFKVHIEPPQGLDPQERWLFSGYVEFQCQTDQGATCESSLVSYGGMHGHLAGIPIFNPAQLTYPALQLDRNADSPGGDKAQATETKAIEEQVDLKHQSGKHRGKVGNGKGVVKDLYRDRSESVTVGKNEDDWVQILVSVNFPTGLLTIEAESVCDNDHGKGDNGGGRVRLEIGGSGQSRFQIETEEGLGTEDDLMQLNVVPTQPGQPHEQRVALTKERLARVQELAFMPGGLYMPYEGYPRSIPRPSMVDEVMLLHRKTKTGKEKQDGKSGNGAAGSGKTTYKKASGRARHRGSKSYLGRKKKGGDKIRGPRKGNRRPPGRQRDKGQAGHLDRADEACVPRILGLIPNGFNPWTTRSDSAEGNTFQSFSWMGDLLLQNHEAVPEDQYNGPPSPDEPAPKRNHSKKGHKKSGGSDQGKQDTQDLPDGRYRLVVKVLKPWGVRGRASDVERWSSPIVVIKRNK